jgi:hypothetical protein
MLVLTDTWNLLDWFNWLENDVNLSLGYDYSWFWYNNSWAVSFADPQHELLALLKCPPGQATIVKEYCGSTTV